MDEEREYLIQEIELAANKMLTIQRAITDPEDFITWSTFCSYSTVLVPACGGLNIAGADKMLECYDHLIEEAWLATILVQDVYHLPAEIHSFVRHHAPWFMCAAQSICDQIEAQL